jgi:hypothetical protein
LRESTWEPLEHVKAIGKLVQQYIELKARIKNVKVQNIKQEE